MEVNLFGDPMDNPPKKKASEYEKKKRKWENGFQKWSDKHSIDGLTHYGSCGNGVICSYCEDNHFGRPCVRALNEMCREKHKTIDYEKTSFHMAFDGEV